MPLRKPILDLLTKTLCSAIRTVPPDFAISEVAADGSLNMILDVQVTSHTIALGTRDKSAASPTQIFPFSNRLLAMSTHADTWSFPFTSSHPCNRRSESRMHRLHNRFQRWLWMGFRCIIPQCFSKSLTWSSHSCWVNILYSPMRCNGVWIEAFDPIRLLMRIHSIDRCLVEFRMMDSTAY